MFRSGARITSFVLSMAIAGFLLARTSVASALPEHVIVLVETDLRSLPRWMRFSDLSGLLPTHREWERTRALSHALGDSDVLSELARQIACPQQTGFGECRSLSAMYDKDLEGALERLEVSSVLLMRILQLGLFKDQTVYVVNVRFDLVSTRPRLRRLKSFYTLHVENVDFEAESLEAQYRESLADISSMASYMIDTDWRGNRRKQPGAWIGLPTLQALMSSGTCVANSERGDLRRPVVRSDGRRAWLGYPGGSDYPATLVSLELTDCERPEEEEVAVE